MADRVGKVTSWTCGATAEGDKYVLGVKTGSYISHCNYKVEIYAYRPNGYTDPNLYFSILCTEMTAYAASTWGTSILGDIDCNYGHEGKILSPDGSRTLGNVATGSTNWIDGPFLARNVMNSQQFGYNIVNTDPPISLDGSTPNPDFLLSKDKTLWTRTHTYINGIENYTNSADERNHRFEAKYYYPPYIDKNNIDSLVSDDKKLSKPGGSGSSGTSACIELKSNYKIVKESYSVKYEWTPNGTSGPLNASIINDLIVNGTTYPNVSSPYSVDAPSSAGISYKAQVKRYYGPCSIADLSGVEAYSNTLTQYTYSKPTLSSIALSKSVISPRSGASIRVSLYGTNDKKHNFENTFRTCIWSPYKDPYLDYETTSTFRDLTADEVKVMFPDSNASNGEINSQVKVKRKNLGISGGNPGNGNLVYQTGTSTKNLKIQYKPTVPINPDIEPNPNDPSNSGIAYYKKEDNREGVKLTAGHTWVLPNTYDISRMNGINIRLQYPKTDASGVLSGYRIRLYSPNDGSPDSNVMYFEDHWNTTNYIDTYFISYDTLRRGISGNEIEITPYYTSSSGEKWYGPTMRKKFVDISWMLNKPVIDCPLTNTTWHNHKYRILFKLPIDRDTNYKGINDIELHYGSGKYRYQEIQMNINGTITTFADNGFYNAHNIWNSPVNVSNANLTYLRNIIVNPSLIGTYSDRNQYIISIRIRKAYGQNPNWDGWSEWSDTITVNRKTVKNDVVNRHEYINATHYMTVQTAFNLSTACYAKKASDNSNFVVKESFDRARGDNINGPHLSPPENQPFQTIREYLSEFKDLHQLKDKINSYATFDTDKNRNPVKLDYQNNLLASFTPIQEFITAAKDQNGATECDSPATILKGRNYMKYMCDEINHLY